MDTVMARAKALQVKCFGTDPSALPTAERVGWQRNMILGMVAECIEVLDEVKGWKWWGVDSAAFDRDAYLEELVDVTVFAHALAMSVGCSDEEWREAYAAKIAVVYARHEVPA
jgi:dimeric dUTPase (all-alpha-NTP-PPase superfamily)